MSTAVRSRCSLANGDLDNGRSASMAMLQASRAPSWATMVLCKQTARSTSSSSIVGRVPTVRRCAWISVCLCDRGTLCVSLRSGDGHGRTDLGVNHRPRVAKARPSDFEARLGYQHASRRLEPAQGSNHSLACRSFAESRSNVVVLRSNEPQQDQLMANPFFDMTAFVCSLKQTPKSCKHSFD